MRMTKQQLDAIIAKNIPISNQEIQYLRQLDNEVKANRARRKEGCEIAKKRQNER